MGRGRSLDLSVVLHSSTVLISDLFFSFSLALIFHTGAFVKSWKARLFVLEDSGLLSYYAEGEEEARGSIDISKALRLLAGPGKFFLDVQKEKKHLRHSCFSFQSAAHTGRPRRTWQLASASPCQRAPIICKRPPWRWLGSGSATWRALPSRPNLWCLWRRWACQPPRCRAAAAAAAAASCAPTTPAPASAATGILKAEAAVAAARRHQSWRKQRAAPEERGSRRLVAREAAAPPPHRAPPPPPPLPPPPPRCRRC